METMVARRQPAVDRLLLRVLRSPLAGAVDSSLLLLTVRGRRSGRAITLPVRYAAGDEAIWVWPGRPETKTWWRNLRVAAPVRLRLLGQDLAQVPGHGVAAAVRRHPQGSFFVLAFACSWGYWIPIAVAGGHLSHFPGCSVPCWPPSWSPASSRAGLALAGAALLLAVPWALWHLPTFWLDTGLRGFPLLMLPGFFVGMVAGAVVLGWLYEQAHSSILVVALFHACLNMASATRGTEGFVATAVSIMVIGWAVALLRAHSGRANAPTGAGSQPVAIQTMRRRGHGGNEPTDR